MDVTLHKRFAEWLKNTKENSEWPEDLLPDIHEIDSAKLINADSITILGSGWTLDEPGGNYPLAHTKKGFVIGNHSNFVRYAYAIDAVVITDAHPIIYEYLKYTPHHILRSAIWIIATYIEPKVVKLLISANCEVYTFLHFMHPPSDQGAPIFNEALRLMWGRDKPTFLYQAGCVSTAAVIFAHRMIEEKLTFAKEFYLHGVDLSFSSDLVYGCVRSQYTKDGKIESISSRIVPLEEVIVLNGKFTGLKEFDYLSQLKFFANKYLGENGSKFYAVSDQTLVSIYFPCKES